MAIINVTLKISAVTLISILFSPQSVTSYNEKKLLEACRAEDGYFKCSDGTCQSRNAILTDNCLTGEGRVVCTSEEITCRGLGRCVTRAQFGTENGCLLGKKGKPRVPCREDEFVCPESRICLPRHSVKNGVSNCISYNITDYSDESKPLPHCIDGVEFQCLDDSERCIPREWVMDGVNDCSNGSDETIPLPNCTNAEYRCKDGRCVLRHRVLDGFADCSNAEDEARVENNTCIEGEFRCQDNGRCIPNLWLLDGILNCRDQSDELMDVLHCADTEYTCFNQRRCLPWKYVCDGVDHCGDCSDEIEACDEARMWRCQDDPSVCIPQSYGCDGFIDCPGGNDNPQYLPGFKCPKTILATSQTQCLVPQWTLTDSFPICEDKSDICFENSTFKCATCLHDAAIISASQICDGYIDCADASDECLCSKFRNASDINSFCSSICYSGLASRPCDKCSARQLYCPLDEKCIPLEDVCNGVQDCPLSQMDEKMCVRESRVSEMETNDTVKNFDCWKLDDIVLDLIKEQNFEEIYKAVFRHNATRCNGIVECSRFEDECDSNCEFPPKECSQFELTTPMFMFVLGTELKIRKCNREDDNWDINFSNYVVPLSLCNGVLECPGGEDEENCTNRFHCNGGKQELPTGSVKDRISIDVKKRCDLTPDCVDYKDEMGCSPSTHFYCEGGVPLFVPTSRVLDGRQDCEDNSDECPPTMFLENPLSSREHLVANAFLRVMIWIMAFVAIIGNCLAIIEIYGCARNSKDDNPLSISNRLLVTNLAASDSLMGIALLLIAVESAITSGSYCNYDKMWRISSTCTAIGVMTVLSSEASVLSLVVLTSFRLHGVFQPFKSRHISLKWAIIMIIGIWIIALIVSVIPVLPNLNHSMISGILTSPSRYFANTVVTWEDFRVFASRIGTLVRHDDNSSVISPRSWNDAVVYLRANYPKEAPEIYGFFGYYSTHGVCLPRLFRLPGTPPLHPLSLIIVSFNFACLLFIIISYVLIYRKSTKKAVVSDKSERRAISMQKKITALVLTDSFCWLPVCLMTFIAHSGVPLTRSAYAFAAIILLPVNSSLNPVIYSRGFAATRKRFKSAVTKRLSSN